MKWLKTLLLLLTCVSISTSLNSKISFASIDGDLSLDEGAEEYIQTEEERLLEAQKIEAVKKNNELDSKGSGIIINSDYDPSIIYILSVPVFKQETDYWCGPATVKQVLHYINKSSLPQNTYAGLLGTTTSGTDMTRIPAVLNNNQSTYTYVMSQIPSRNTWEMYIKNNTKNLQPVVLDIKVNENDGWAYTTSGHFVCTSAFDGRTFGTTLIEIADPHPKYYGRKWYSSESLYKVNQQHWRSSMIW